MKRFLMFFLVAGLLSPTCLAQSLEWHKLNNFLDALEAHNKFMGSIAVSKDENRLIAQATGQSAFPLEHAEKHVFKFGIAGDIMVFNLSKNTMLLKQGGAQFNFIKE